MANQNRRNFLRDTGAALAGLAAFPRLRAKVSSSASESHATLAGLPIAQSTPPPHKPIRGLMVDAARLPESPDYYRRVIEFCAEWDLNTLQVRLTDDQGSALRFASVPGLVTHPDALTPDQAKSLVEFAASHGVDLLPEIESFGHTGYITRSPQYAHLLDADPRGSAEFTGVIPVLSETGDLMEKLYREVAAIFPSTYLHAGCDEVNWGGSAQSRKALETHTRAQIWADYLNSLHRIAAALGKQLIVWGDHVLHKEPILDQLDKNIVIMDWNYWDTGAIAFHDSLSRIQKSGHRGIGAPALISYRWGPRPGSEQLRNIDAFAEAYCGAGDPASLGVILTNWVPTRYVQDSLWDGFAYAAVAFKESPSAARLSALRRFVERHYRAEWNDRWEEAFDLFYDTTPGYGDRASISPSGLHLSTPWSSDAQLTEALKQRLAGANPFTRLRSLLVQLQPAIRRNVSDFQAFALSAECLQQWFWRDAAVREQAAQKPLDQDATKLLIETIAQRDRDLAERLVKDWDNGRSPDSAAKQNLIFDLEPKDQLLYQWRQAAAYSSSLALHPDHFHQLLRGVSL